MSQTAALTTADLPDGMRLDVGAFLVRQAACQAGLSLSRAACRCAVQRADCPACLTALIKVLAAR